jgi:hypothetical protein
MAINQAVCATFKQQLLDGDHDISSDTFKLALYTILLLWMQTHQPMQRQTKSVTQAHIQQAVALSKCKRQLNQN